MPNKFQWGKGLGGNSGLQPSGIKRKPIKLKSKPKKVDEELMSKDKAFYQSIWEEMETPRRCYETGKLLPKEPSAMMFHHILHKSLFPEFRHEKWNIVVLLPQVHSQVHLDIDRTPKVKELTLLTQDIFKELKKGN